ncbi:helix-turn-helix domain-containing protein [Amycolatopsis rhizosphaerae]|uniref:Helix-turn-helix domain-containing protein n=1 Tax=Amycolatopsis rhizosphaerae TaxID=2053003 RepID=A0A558DLI1_9PSEU|nr:helix-turn-helix domain-containing protein [Amycolatopsis rhizosphaerae]
MHVKIDAGRVLRERRDKLGATGEEVAGRLGTTAATISNIENSRSPSNSCYYYPYQELLIKLERQRLRELVNQHPEELVKIVCERLSTELSESEN